jgi:surface polysaccharide O-acyltransferase-like enzyme
MTSSSMQIDPTVLPPTRIVYADWLRTIAITMVIMLHLASPYLFNQNLTPATASTWWSATLLMSLMRPAVPLFIMLSGVVLLQPQKVDEPLGIFFRKRLGRILLPFVFWSAVYFGWRIHAFKQSLTIGQMVLEFLHGTTSPHLWYVYMLISLYLATPLLRVYVSRASRSNLAYCMGIAVLGAIVVPLLRQTLGWESRLFYDFPFVGAGYIGFFLAGYYLHGVTVPRRWMRLLPLVIVLLAYGTALLTGWVTTQAQGKIDTTWQSNLTPNVAMMSVCAFLWLKQLPYARWVARWPWLNPIVKTVSALSFTIYLNHTLLTELCQTGRLGFKLTELTITPYLVIPVLTVFVLAASVGMIKLIRCIPGGRLIAT